MTQLDKVSHVIGLLLGMLPHEERRVALQAHLNVNVIDLSSTGTLPAPDSIQRAPQPR